MVSPLPERHPHRQLDVPGDPVALPAGFNTLTKPQTTLQFTPQQVAAERQNWIGSWQRAVSR